MIANGIEGKEKKRTTLKWSQPLRSQTSSISNEDMNQTQEHLVDRISSQLTAKIINMSHSMLGIDEVVSHLALGKLNPPENESDTSSSACEVKGQRLEKSKAYIESTGTMCNPVEILVNFDDFHSFSVNEQPMKHQDFLMEIFSKIINQDCLKQVCAHSSSKYLSLVETFDMIKDSQIRESAEELFSSSREKRQLFSAIITEDLMSLHDFIQGSSHSLEEIHGLTNEFNLSALDVCYLMGKSNLLTSTLIMLGFKLGPIFLKAIQEDPNCMSFFSRSLNMDILGCHLIEEHRKLTMIDPNLIKIHGNVYKILMNYLMELISSHKALPVESINRRQVKAFPISERSFQLKILPSPLGDGEKSANSSSDEMPVTSNYKTSIYCYRIEMSCDRQFSKILGIFFIQPVISIDKLSKAYYHTRKDDGFIMPSFYRVNLGENVPSQIYLRIYAFSLRGWTSSLYINQKPIELLSNLVDMKCIVCHDMDDTRRTTEIRNKVLREIKFIMSKKKVKNKIDQENTTAEKEEGSSERETVDGNIVNRLYKNIFTGSRFTKNCQQSGFYFAFVCLKKMKMNYFSVATFGDCIPFIKIFNEEISKTDFENIFLWLNKVIEHSNENIDFKKLKNLSNSMDYSIKSEIKVKLINTLEYISSCINFENVGTIYPRIFHVKRKKLESTNTCEQKATSDHSNVIIIVKLLTNNIQETLLSGNLKWSPLRKFIKKSIHDQSLPMEFLSLPQKAEYVITDFLNDENQIFTLVEDFIQLAEKNYMRLSRRGLYLFYLQMLSQIDSLGKCLALNETEFGYSVPWVQVRRRHYITPDEWRGLRNFTSININKNNLTLSRAQRNFIKRIFISWKELSQKMNMTYGEMIRSRLYIDQVVDLNSQCLALVIVPEPEKIYRIVSSQNILTLKQSQEIWLPILYLEMKIMQIFNPELYSMFPNVSSSLEFIIPIVKQTQKTCLDETHEGERNLSNVLSILEACKVDLEDIWQGKRWISKILNKLRSKRNLGEISVEMSSLNPLKFNQNLNLASDFSQFLNDLKRMSQENYKSDTNPSLPPGICLTAGPMKIFVDFRKSLCITVFVKSTVTTDELIKVCLKRLKITILESSKYHLCVRISDIERVLPDDFHPMLLKFPWRAGQLILKYKDDVVKPTKGPCLLITIQSSSHLKRVLINKPIVIHQAIL